MKKLKYFLLFLLFTQFQFAQSKIFLGVNTSPSISFPAITELNNYLDGNANISVGISGMYSIDNNILLKSGLIYNQRSFRIKGIPNTTGVPLNVDLEWLRTHYNVISTFTDTEIYQSVTIPLSIEYKLSNFEETSFLFSGGIEVGYLFNVKYVYDYNSGEQRIYNKDFNDFIGSINLGVGLYQPISNNFLLLITPRYSYSFYPNFGKMGLNFNTISLDAEFYFQLN